MAELKTLLRNWANLMEANKQRLIELDGLVGDSDLGLTMADGFRAAYEAVMESPEADIGKLSYAAGKAMGNAVPSTMGTLMASGFMNAGKVLKGSAELDRSAVTAFFEAYLAGVQNRGKAELGEKTFLDGLAPAVESLRRDAANGVAGDHRHSAPGCFLRRSPTAPTRRRNAL